jgi:hypothetical protein
MQRRVHAPLNGMKRELRGLSLALRSGAITCGERVLSERYTKLIKLSLLAAVVYQQRRYPPPQIRKAKVFLLLALYARRRLWRWKPVTIRLLVRPPVAIASYSDDECWNNFGFRHQHLGMLINILELPNMLLCPNGTKYSDEEAFLIFLARLRSSMANEQLAEKYGRENSQVSRCFGAVCKHIFDRWRYLLLDSVDRHVADFPSWAAALANHPSDSPYVGIRIAVLLMIALFFDATKRRVRRCSPHPAVNDLQRMCYDGRKSCHTVGYQGLCAPNGLMVSNGVISVCLSNGCLSVCLSVCLSICLCLSYIKRDVVFSCYCFVPHHPFSLFLPPFRAPIGLMVSNGVISVCLSVYLSVCLSVSLIYKA